MGICQRFRNELQLTVATKLWDLACAVSVFLTAVLYS